jgi:7-cyano-7-deazaguanine synthase
VPHNTPCVVLLSGGLDSATVLAYARAQGFACHTLSFDYGQRHRHELAAAATLALRANAASHRTVALDLRALGGSALTSDIPVPKDRDLSHPASDPARDIPITYVPARNLIFLSIATAVAEVHAANDIFIGVNALDYSGYPDCRPDFIRAFAHAATLGTKSGVTSAPFNVHAPLINLSKADIIRLGLSLSVDFALTHSCYDPVIAPDARVLACGHCDSCALRHQGFRAANVPDPTPYATPPAAF